MFNQGLCYWFAFILVERFKPFASMVYAPAGTSLDNHFLAKIGDDLYDINGLCLADRTDFVDWDTYEDTLNKARVHLDCVLKSE